jgi:Calcineurin-like phosphoesterase
VTMQEITPSVYIIGDIHGQLKRLLHLLEEAHLINHKHTWIGGNAILWFLGDFVDRGPDGIEVINLVMRLQTEAATAGGQVSSLLGNHEMLLFAAYRFGRRSTGLGSSFISRWKQNGGNKKDITSLTREHLAWMAELPPMALVADRLLMHADNSLYLKHGRSIDEVNAAFKKLLRASNALDWEETLEDFAQRGVFMHKSEGENYARRFLSIFGGKQLIHGHTPISLMLNSQAKKVTEPFIYANETCVNVDGGLFLGGPGFIYRVPTEQAAT